MSAAVASMLRPAVTAKRCAAALLAIALIAPAAAAVGEEKPKGMRAQQASTWCWAAASQMVMEAMKSDPDYIQPAQAERAVLGCTSAPRDTCTPANSVHAGCNRPGFPSFDHYNVPYKFRSLPLSWDDLQRKAKPDHPVLFGWCVEGRCGGTPRTSMGHWMVAIGTSTCPARGSTSVRMVTVNNPAPCCKGQVLYIPYETYATGGAGLKFWRNYYKDAREMSSDGGERETITRLVPVDSFPPSDPKSTPADEAQASARTCLLPGNTWSPDSRLLRDEIDPPKDTTEVKASPTTISRHYIPLAALGALTTEKGYAGLQAMMPPAPLTVVTLTTGDDKYTWANVVLAGLGDQFQTVGFEDYEAARRLIARAEKAAKYKVDPITKGDEYVILETGLHFRLVANEKGTGQDAIVILSEIDCRNPLPKEEAEAIPFAKLIEKLTVSD